MKILHKVLQMKGCSLHKSSRALIAECYQCMIKPHCALRFLQELSFPTVLKNFFKAFRNMNVLKLNILKALKNVIFFVELVGY